MKFDLNKIDAAPSGRIRYTARPFPYFLAIPIKGVGTGSVEALSSYLCRQAELLSEWSHGYTTRLYKSVADHMPSSNFAQISKHALYTCNGIGKWEQFISKAISVASEGAIDPTLMTLRSITYLSDRLGHGLVRDSMCWCPYCWQEDTEKGDTPYLRLYWTLKQTQICAIHNERLIELCPACNEPKQLFPKFPRQHICDKCGHALYEINKKYCKGYFTDQESWFSHSIYALFERLSSRQYSITPDTLSRSIQRLLNTSKLSINELSEKLKIDKRMLTGLLKKTRRPYFPAFMDMCFRLDIPPDQFLFDTDLLTSPASWKTHDHENFVSMSKLSPQKKQRMYESLQRAIKSKSNPPVRVSYIAQKYGVRSSTIRYNFCKEYNELRQRWTKWQRDFNKASHQQRIEQLADGVFSLVRRGIYPSERKLRDLCYLKPSDLRRDDIKYLLTAFQDTYRSLGMLGVD